MLPFAESRAITRCRTLRTSGALLLHPILSPRFPLKADFFAPPSTHSQSYIFAACVAATLAGWGAKASNRYKWIGILGVLIHMAGTWLMMRARNLDSSTFELVVSQLLGGVGGGFTTIAAQLGCQSVVGHQGAFQAWAIREKEQALTPSLATEQTSPSPPPSSSPSPKSAEQ